MSESHRPWRELIGSFVLGQLEPEEEVSLRAHLDGCSSCRREAEELAAVAVLLPEAEPRRIDEVETPPASLEARVFARLHEEQQLRVWSRRRRMRTRIAAGLAAAAVAVGAFVVVSRGPTPDQVELVSFRSLPPGAEAEAKLRTVEEGIEVELQMRGMPGGAWVIAVERADGSVAEATTFQAPSGSWHGRRALSVQRADAVRLVVRLTGGDATIVAPLSRR